jgi:hypothetical protein
MVEGVPARSANPLAKYYPQAMKDPTKTVNAYNMPTLKRYLESDTTGRRRNTPFQDPAKTNEIIEKFMSMSSREEYLKENPNMETVISGGANFIDPVRLGIRKPDQGFKEVLQRIHEKTPGSQLNKNSNI